MDSILPIHHSPQSERWSGKLQEKFEKALEALVQGKTPKDAVYQRKGRGGRNFSYVTGYWVVEQLNSLFDYNWDWEIEDQHIGTKQVWVRGKLTIHILTQEGDHVTITKHAFGGSDIKTLREGGDVIDIADDLKAASTDALKKASSLLGLASDLYGGEEQVEENLPDQTILRALQMRATQLKWNEEDLIVWIKTESGGKDLSELSKGQVNGLLGKLVAKVRETQNSKEGVVK